MKRISLFFLLALALISCKDNGKNEVDLEENRSKSYSQDDGLITVKGDFIYYADAAVLQTSKEIYGVVIDKNLHLLNEQVRPYKKEATDMVPVTVRVRKFKKPKDQEGWPYRVEIKEILKVEAPDPKKDDVIKLAN